MNLNASPSSYTSKPSFSLKKANWEAYKKSFRNNFTDKPPSENVNKEAAMLRTIIMHSAHQSIPQNSTFQFPRTVPWWNQNLSVLKKAKSSKWSILKHNITTYNIIEYKRANAKKSHYRSQTNLYF